MTWITGTATDYKNLLLKVKDHAVANGWTVNDYQTNVNLDGQVRDVLFLKGPGFGVGYEVYFGIRTHSDPSNSVFGFTLRGYTNYDIGADWNTQPGASPSESSIVMRLWNATIDYWLSVSDRRILLIAKVSNTYHSLYAGFYNSFADPTEYPYPMYIAADAPTHGTFGAVEHTARSVAFPGLGAAMLREPGGMWRNVAVYDSAGLWGFCQASGSRYTVWPYTLPAGSQGANEGYSNFTLPNARIESLPGVADSTFLMNCYLIGTLDNSGVMGTLEGLYWTTGNAASAEQQLTVGAETYRTFIAISRSTENQFYAVKEA